MRVVLTGASGHLGAYLVDALVETRHQVSAWSGAREGSRSGLALERVPLTDAAALGRALDAASPDAVLHVAGISKPALALQNPDRAWCVNVDATRLIAEWCSRHDRRLIFTSTDLVFDGMRGWYREDDAVNPVVEYARTKVAAEAAVAILPRGLVARMSLMFGPAQHGNAGYFDTVLGMLREGQPQLFFNDEFRTPLDYESAARILVALLETERCGVVHVGGADHLSRFELMTRIAAALGIGTGLVRANSLADLPSVEPRPADVSLDTTRLSAWLPDMRRKSVEEAAQSWFRE